jgi:hypothetical protein
MKKLTLFTIFFAVTQLISPVLLFAKPGDPIVNILDTSGITKTSTELIYTVFHSEIATYALYLTLCGTVVGLYYGLKRFWISSIAIFIALLLFRSYYDLLFSSTRTFLILVITPIFFITFYARMAIKDIGEQKEAEAKKPKPSNKAETASKYKRFNEEKDKDSTRDRYMPSMTDTRTSIANVKLTRPL